MKKKSGADSNGINKSSMKRGSYCRSLAVEWVRTHRPDVMEAITTESYKKYPLAGTRRAKVSLPKELASLK